MAYPAWITFPGAFQPGRQQSSAYNDMLAIGLLKGLQLARLEVPAEISVTGFDNIRFSTYTNPAADHLDQPKRFIGLEAARLMLDLLEMHSFNSG